MARFDQRLGLGDQGPEAIGVDADHAPVELDETGAGDRNPVQRCGQSEEAMEPRQPRVDAPGRQIEHLAGEIELADRLRGHGQRHEQGADLGRRLHDHAVNRDPHWPEHVDVDAHSTSRLPVSLVWNASARPRQEARPI